MKILSSLVKGAIVAAALSVPLRATVDLSLRYKTYPWGAIQTETASNTIKAGEAVEISSGANITFQAGGTVDLKPGFHASNGSAFHVVLSPSGADTDHDGLPDAWENTYLGGLGQGPLDDPDGDGLTNLVEYQLGTNPNSYDPGSSSLGNTEPAGWGTLVAANTSKTNVVGTTVGTLNVDKSGAATYSIPLWVSPGTAGMQPQIALNYSSQAGSGIAGFGWSLSGISTISRGPQTYAVDGQVHGVDFSYADRYYLDGQRLIAISGSDGAANTEYRTEMDSFSRIVSYGSAGNGPAYFKVWTKAGLIIEFGHTTDSAAIATGRTEVLSWAVNKISDTTGNYMTFTYYRDGSVGEQRLTRIDYTGNAGTGLATYASVRFGYESRPDTFVGYMAGSTSSRTQRLKTISSYYGETLIRQYTLDYVNRDLAPGDGLGRSIVTKLHEADGSGTEYPPLTFDYDATSVGWDQTTSWNLPTFLAKYNATPRGGGFIDLNGDGRPDFVIFRLNSSGTVAERDAWINDPVQGWVHADGSVAGVPDWRLPAALAKDGSTDLGTRFVDIDGDGLIDVMCAGFVYLNTGHGWSDQSAQWSLPLFGAQEDVVNGSETTTACNTARSGYCQLIDLNGDGRPDYIAKDALVSYSVIRDDGFGNTTVSNYSYTETDVWLNTGTGWSRASNYAPPFNMDKGSRFMDVNGDGLPDQVQNWRDQATLLKGVALNTGSGWNVLSSTSPLVPPELLNQNSGGTDGATVGTESVDLNGDGLVDLIRRNDAGGYSNGNSVWFNTGNGWVAAPGALASPFELAHDNLPQGIAFLDINSDGIPDIVQGWGTTRDTRLGTGKSWSTSASGYNLVRQIAQSNLAGTGTDFIDIDGDGAVDQIFSWQEGDGTPVKGLAVNRAKPADHLIKVTNGFNVSAAIAYAPLTQRDSAGAFTVYDKATTIPSANVEPGAVNVIGPMYVVKSVSNDDGVGGQHVVNYRYGGLRSHRLRGGLGFATVATTDTRTGIVSTTTFRQDFPYIGMPISSNTVAPTGPSTTVVLSESATTYDERATTYTPDSTHTYQTHFVFAKTTTSTSRDLFSDATARSAAAANHTDIVAQSTTTTQRGPLGQNDDYDAYGNSKYVSVDSGESHVKTTVSVYDNTVTTDKWFLGRLTSSTATSTGPTGDADIPSSLVRKSSFTYDSATGLLLTETVEPDDTATADNNPLKLVTTYHYDGYGNKDTVTVSGAGLTDAAGNAANRITQTHYDARGRFPDWTKNALNHEEDYTAYDQNLGVLKSLQGPNNLTTSWEYDSFGRKTREVRADGTETRMTYRWSGSNAPSGALYHVLTEASGSPSSVVFYDSFGRSIYSYGLNGGRPDKSYPVIVGQHTTYDNLGRAYRTSLPFYFGSAEAFATEVTSYDLLNRPLQQRHADEGSSTGYYVTGFAYAGLVTSVTDANNKRAESTKDLQGQVVKVIANADTAAGADDRGETRFVYDPLGNLCKTTVVKSASDTCVTKVTYDLRGRKIQMVDPDMGTWNYRYNAAGELVWQQDATPQQTTLRYDQLGRLVQRVEPEGTTTWTYDTATYGIGKLAAVTAPAGNTAVTTSAYQETYIYDSLGRPTTVKRQIDGLWYATTQSYDSYSRPEVAGYPGPGASTASGAGAYYFVKNLYNAAGFLREVRQACNSGSLTGDTPNNYRFWQAESYSIWGQVDGARLGNGLVYSVGYSDKTGRISSISCGPGTSYGVANYAYLYDGVGNVTTRNDSAVGRTEGFVYDGLNRLTTATTTVAAGGLGTSGTQSATYDAYGNILSKTGVGTYTYDSTHKHQVKSVTGGTLQAAAAYDYDANGNLYGGAGRSIAWSSCNQVKRIDGPNGVYSAFAFGAGHERVIQQTQAGRTIYVGGSYEQTTRGSVVERKYYIFAPTGRVAVRTEIGTASVETRYLHADALGSVTAVTSETGDVIQRFVYDPWGRRTATDGSPSVTRGYTDHEHLDDLGLIHMNGRVYDPVLGRFLSADPNVDGAYDSQGYNRYSYVGNNPMNRTDPSGYFSLKDAFVMVVAIVVTIVVTVVSYGALTGQTIAAMGGFWSAAGTALTAGGWAGFGAVVAGGAAGGFTSGFAGSLLNGGSIGDAFKSGVIGAAWGAASAAIAFGIGQGFDKLGWGDDFFEGGWAGRAVAHGSSQGLITEAQGGEFRHGFYAAAFASAASPALGKWFPDPEQISQRTAVAAAIGGTASVMGGGKFANGAFSGAFTHLFNAEAKNIAQLSARNTARGAIERVLLAEAQSPYGTKGYDHDDNLQAMEYMAAVIQNRIGTPGFASTVEGVITQGGQFKGFENYPNYSKDVIDRIEDMKGWATVKNRYQQEYKEIFAKAKSLAVDVTSRAVVDPYKGSGGLIYFRTAGSTAPYAGAKVQVTAGGQDFYGPRPK